MLTVILQMNLFDAVPYIDLREALETARSEPPDYLISDITMPGMLRCTRILSRTPKRYWMVRVRFVMLCALVVVSVAIATTV